MFVYILYVYEKYMRDGSYQRIAEMMYVFCDAYAESRY